MQENFHSVYSCPNPSVSSTAMDILCSRASWVLYGGRSSRLKLLRVSKESTQQGRKHAPCVGLGQRRRIARFFNRESSRAVRSLKILESVDRDTRGTRGELKQSRLLLGIPRADNLPEVLDHLVLLLVAPVVGVPLPVVHVDVRNTSDQQFQLALVEHVHQICRNQLVEPGHEGIELLLDALHDLPFRHQPVV